MYNEYLINKMVDTSIKKYATYFKKRGSNLDLLEQKQREIENHCESNIVLKNERIKIYGFIY